ncbi:MAG: HU family DNA-binding protein [Pseudomonadota bacterium]
MGRQPKTEAIVPDADPLKKPDLLDQVVARTNLKKRDVKPAVEAALSVIGDALRDGQDVNLPPLGKLRVVKTKDLDDGAAILTLKLRTPKHASVAATGVAPDALPD